MTLRRWLWWTLAVGLLLRLLSAFFVFGPQALDDYKHGVLPAYQWAAGLADDLPGYRNYLLVWALGVINKAAVLFGFDSPVGQVRWMYTGLALWSLLAWVFVAEYFGERKKAAIWLWALLATYPLMPFVSTRAFGEAAALPLVLSGLLGAEIGRRGGRNALGFLMAGFLFLGVATYLRFQVGVIYVVVMVLFAVEKRWREVAWAVALGGIVLVGQILMDWASGRRALGTLLNYLAANEGGAVQYGVSPWYNTWVLVLGLLLVPFSLGFGSAWWVVLRRHWRLVVPVFVFVLLHSLTPHKEERFMFPIVGVSLLFLADLLAETESQPFTRRFFRPFLYLLTGIGLAVTCFNNTQVGEIGPAAEISRLHPRAVYLDKASLLSPSRIKEFFIRPPSEVVEVADLNAEVVDSGLERNSSWTAAALLTSDPQVEAELKKIAGQRTRLSQCGQVEAASSWVDALLYKMNPKHNQRRRPTWYVLCERVSG